MKINIIRFNDNKIYSAKVRFQIDIFKLKFLMIFFKRLLFDKYEKKLLKRVYNNFKDHTRRKIVYSSEIQDKTSFTIHILNLKKNISILLMLFNSNAYFRPKFRHFYPHKIMENDFKCFKIYLKHFFDYQNFKLFRHNVHVKKKNQSCANAYASTIITDTKKIYFFKICDLIL